MEPVDVRPPPPAALDGTGVTAVLVSHDGAAWLPAALAALRASATQPGQLVLVDTGSTDSSADLLRELGPVLCLPRDTGYGAAVAAGLATVATTPWIWLLHDDAAVDPHALSALLAHAMADDTVAMVGPKTRDWDDERLLVEVGLTTDPGGHRHTGVDGREYDQGQHDIARAVLAVGTAGALVRRAAWDAVGGLDPSLPLYRDDLDLGWRLNAAGHRVVVDPRASQRHVRAATTGRRAVTAVRGRPGAADRRHAVQVVLAHTPSWSVLPRLLALVAAGVLRASALLLTRQLGPARDELTALTGVLARPGHLLRLRQTRARTRSAGRDATRVLLAGRTDRLRGRLELLTDEVGRRLTTALGGTPGVAVDRYGALGDAGPEGPDAAAELAPAGPGVLRLLVRQPAVLLLLGLTALTAIACRDLIGTGPLLGGRLLPAPAGASDLWTSYAGSWHETSGGTAAPAAPIVGVLALLSTLMLGKAGLAVSVLLLAAVPLSGLAAYAAARRLTPQPVLRAWAALGWAGLPVLTGGVADGRLDVAVVHLALPLLLSAGWSLVSTAGPVRRSWALGLALAVVSAVAPLLWPVAAAVLVVAAAVCSWRRLPVAALAAGVPAVLLAPWLLTASWDAVLDGPGVRMQELAAPLWRLLLLDPAATTWTAGALLVAGLAALLHRSPGVVGGWLLAGLGWLLAASLTRAGHDPALPLQLAAAGLLIAAVVAADGLRERLARASFGWRQVAAVPLVALAALGPAAAAVSWAGAGADGPLTRDRAPVLPAFAAAELAASPGLRVLTLRPGAAVGYSLSGAAGPVLGDADLPLASGQQPALDAVVADLLTARGSDAAEALATRAVRYVALPASPAAAPLIAALDSQTGLARRTSGELLLWRVLAPAAPLTVLSGESARVAQSGVRSLGPVLQRTAPARPTGERIGAGPPGRLVVLAQSADPGWQASYDGQPLRPVTAWGWAQAFVLPAGPGTLVVDHQARRTHVVALQGVVLVVLVVLAAPGGRRRRGLEEVPA